MKIKGVEDQILRVRWVAREEIDPVEEERVCCFLFLLL